MRWNLLEEITHKPHRKQNEVIVYQAAAGRRWELSEMRWNLLEEITAVQSVAGKPFTKKTAVPSVQK
jgi:hypothetical protein